MYAFTPTISDGDLIIVGYRDATLIADRRAYKIPVTNITASVDQQHSIGTPTKWTELTATDHYSRALVPSSSPPVLLGGHDKTGTITTADIKMYDSSNKSWKMFGSLSSARSRVAVAMVYNNAIIVIGGYTKGGSVNNALSSSLTIVELGQAELLH